MQHYIYSGVPLRHETHRVNKLSCLKMYSSVVCRWLATVGEAVGGEPIVWHSDVAM